MDELEQTALAGIKAHRTYADGKVTLDADVFDDLLEAARKAALAARSEPGAEALREAVVAYFDGRRRRAPAAEMLRLITKMGDSLAATPAADSRGLDPMVTPVSQDVIRATQDAMQRLAEARSGPVFVPYEDATALAFAVVDAMRAEYAALTDPDPAP